MRPLYPESEYEWVTHEAIITKDEVAIAIMGHRRIITSGWDGTIRVWDFFSGLQVLKIKAHQGGVYNTKYDPSGKYIVSGGDDFLVKEWDAETGKMICELPGHKGGVGEGEKKDVERAGVGEGKINEGIIYY